MQICSSNPLSSIQGHEVMRDANQSFRESCQSFEAPSIEMGPGLEHYMIIWQRLVFDTLRAQSKESCSGFSYDSHPVVATVD
jgi:hypothetical protein